MKKRSLVFLLCLCVLFTGCAQPIAVESEPTEKAPKTVEKPSANTDLPNKVNCYGAPIHIEEGEYPTIVDAPATEIMGRSLTWENINSFPIDIHNYDGEHIHYARRLKLSVESSVAGLSISSPFSVNREPWQGQSHVCSARLYLRAHPR